MTTSSEATRRTEEVREEMRDMGADYLPMAARAGRNGPWVYESLFSAARDVVNACCLAQLARTQADHPTGWGWVEV